MRAQALLPIAAIALGGCFSYVRKPSEDVRATDGVRLTLNDQGRVDIAALVGPRAASLEGIVASLTDSTYVLNVKQLTRLGGVDEIWTGEAVTVPRRDVTETAVRHFSTPRTLALAAVIVGGTVGVRSGAGGITGSGRNTGGSGQ